MALRRAITFLPARLPLRRPPGGDPRPPGSDPTLGTFRTPMHMVNSLAASSSPRDRCDRSSPGSPVDRTLFRTASVAVGAFRCPVADPRFSGQGTIEHRLVVFPRTSVVIRHAAGPRFVADPRVATLYHPHQEYDRLPVSPDGDRSDWFGVEPALAAELESSCGALASGDGPAGALPFTWSDTPTYFAQRRLFHALERDELEPLQGEQAVLELVAAVLASANGGRRPARRLPAGTERLHRELAEAARRELARGATERLTLGELSRRLHVSPFHLCRVFRAQVGTTLHEYQVDVRVRVALERLAEPHVALSRLALDLGFASHSHFTAAVRRRLHTAPSAARRALRGRP